MNELREFVDSESLKLHSSEFGGLQVLPCPQCNFEYVHIIQVSVNRERDKIIARHDEVSIKEEANTTKGVIISIEYVCESFHHGLIFFHFFEGNVEICHKPLPQLKGEFKDLFRK